jgi:hypothetical protein
MPNTGIRAGETGIKFPVPGITHNDVRAPHLPTTAEHQKRIRKSPISAPLKCDNIEVIVPREFAFCETDQLGVIFGTTALVIPGIEFFHGGCVQSLGFGRSAPVS